MEPSFKQALDQLAGPTENSPRFTAAMGLSHAANIYVATTALQRRELECFYESEVSPAPTADFPLNQASAQLHKEHCTVHLDTRCCHHCHKVKKKMASCAKCRHAWCASRQQYAPRCSGNNDWCGCFRDHTFCTGLPRCDLTADDVCAMALARSARITWLLRQPQFAVREVQVLQPSVPEGRVAGAQAPLRAAAGLRRHHLS